jgi:tetratricopeptide (TPR) repeat protein
VALAEFEAQVGQLDGHDGEPAEQLDHVEQPDHVNQLIPVEPVDPVDQPDQPDQLDQADHMFIAAALVRVARWQAHLLIDAGDHQQAALRLRYALAEANRLGLEQLRFYLLLERVRLNQAIGVDTLDDLAALGSLAERLAEKLELEVEVRAELVLFQANALQNEFPAGSAQVDDLASAAATDAAERLTRALESLDAARLETPRLRAELVLARARKHSIAGRFDHALQDLDTALAIFVNDLAGARAGALEARAHMLRAQIGARTGRCDLAMVALDHLWATMREQRDPEGSIDMTDRAGPANPTDPTDLIMQVVHAFASPVSPACKKVHERAWAFVSNRRQSEVRTSD